MTDFGYYRKIMPSPQRIGFYLTDDNVVLVESNQNKLQKIVSLPVTLQDSTKSAPLNADLSNEIQMVSFLQKAFREQKIDPGQVCVSLPIKEVFLRSFVIPLMPASELNNVIYYEAKKYVPFDLKSLDYLYKAIPFIENKQKRLRIIFYGARKLTLEKYDRIFKQIGCKPILYEPALISLVKQLIDKNHIRPEQNIVVVYVRDHYGQIIFYEKGISYFVREFPLNVTDAHDPKAGPEIIRMQILREVRKSIEYYSRQFSQEKVKEILVLTPEPDKDLVQILTEELSLKARSITPSVTVGLQTFVGMEILCACGSCVTKGPSNLASFNFLQATQAPQPSDPTKAMPWYVTQLITWDIKEIKYLIQTIIVCALLLGGAFAFSRIKLQDIKKQNDSLTHHQVTLDNKSVEDIEAEIKNNIDKLKNYKKILQPTSMAFFLVGITKALPPGIWLDNVKIQSADSSHISIEINGWAYLKKVDAQFRTVKTYLSNLKANELFSSVKLKVNTREKTQKNDYDVVSFSISGS